MTTPDQVVAKRLRVEQLRREISMLEQAKATDEAVADLAVQERALDEEINRLENERARAANAAEAAPGGSVAEALAAMALAEQGAAAPSSRPVVGATSSTTEVTPPVPAVEVVPDDSVAPTTPAEGAPVPVVSRPAINNDKTEGEGN